MGMQDDYEYYTQAPKTIPKTEIERDVKLVEVTSRAAQGQRLVPVMNKKGEIVRYQLAPVALDFSEIFDEDMTLSNLDSVELVVAREVGNLCLYTQTLSESIGCDLKESQQFFSNMLKLFLLTSRAKGGTALQLMKTDKYVSEQTVHSIQKQLENEEKKKRFGIF